MKARYAVVSGSKSGHCCFAWSVIDLTKPIYNPDGSLLDDDPVCECFVEADARRIALLLNAGIGARADQ